MTRTVSSDKQMTNLSEMSHLKCIKSTINWNRIVYLTRTYCSDKKVDVNKTINKKLNKKGKPIRVNESFEKKEDHYTENLKSDPDEEICTVTERERDAAVRSRLSKACNTLTNRKIPLTPSVLNSYLETKTPKESGLDELLSMKTAKNSKQDTQGAVLSDKPPESPPLGRIIRQEPGKVLFAFIPEEWLRFFIPKTGVTGFYTFLFTFGTYLVSKEHYVLEHNYYGGLSMMILCWAAIKYVGPPLKVYLDREIDIYETSWNRERVNANEILEEQIEDEHLHQRLLSTYVISSVPRWIGQAVPLCQNLQTHITINDINIEFQADGQMLLIEAKRENVALQLEEEFRKRQMYVYEEVKNRLDYHVKVDLVHKRIQHKNLVEYVNKEVLKSITPEMQNQLINISIDNILLELEKSEKK